MLVGTNWKPRTSPKKWDSEGYFFFQVRGGLEC